MRISAAHFLAMFTLAACATGILSLAPVEWISPVNKFWLAIVIILFGGGILFGKSISASLREYRETKEETGYMPRSIKYENYRREHYVDPRTGSGEVNYHLKVTNIGEDKIEQVAIPLEFEIPHPRGHRKKTQLNIERVLIDNNELEDPDECYRKICEKRDEDGTYIEEGYLQIPLDQVGGLKQAIE